MIDWVSQHSGLIILLAFFTAFVGIAIWAYLPENKARLEDHAQIPLKEVKE